MSRIRKKPFVNSSDERRIQMYPRTTLSRLIIGRGASKGLAKKSEMALDIIQTYFFNHLTEKDRQHYMAKYEELYGKNNKARK